MDLLDVSLLMLSVSAITCSALIAGGWLRSRTSGARWQLIPGRDNPMGQYDLAPRYVVRGPHGRPVALTEYGVQRAERDYRKSEQGGEL